MVLFSSLAPTNWLVFGIAGQSNILAAPGVGDSWPIPPTNDRCWDWDGPLGVQQIQHLEEPHPGNDTYKPRNGSPMPEFANGISAADPTRQVLIVRTAIGGTALLDANAVPANSWGPNGDLFPNSVARIKAAVAALENAGHTVDELHILWSQGFADAKGGAGNLAGNAYRTAQINLLTRYRAAVTGLNRPDLQLYTEENYAPYGTPGVSAQTLTNCETIKTQQLDAVSMTPGLHIAFDEGVSVIRENGWLNSFDQLHYSQQGLNYAGTKYAEYVAADLDLGDIPYLGDPMISHMFHRFKYAPEYVPVPPPAGPTFTRWHTSGESKNAGTPTTTNAVTLAAAVAAGQVLVISAAADNRATSGPEIVSLTKPGGETNNWVLLGKVWGGGSGTASTVCDLWAIKTTVEWPSAMVITITYDNTTPAKAAVIGEFAGASVTLRGAAVTNVSASGLPSATLAGVQISDLVLGAGAWETHNQPTGDADTTGGSWSAIQMISTAGGLEQSNVTASLQYKIANAAVSQTYNPTGNHAGGTAAEAEVVLAALQPA